MNNDPRGHLLLEKRIDSIPKIIESMLDHPLQRVLGSPPIRFITTGVGSSETHARYIAHLINQYTPASANFLPLSTFYSPIPKPAQKTILIAFSQGISPNILLALSQDHCFEQVILFTAATIKGSIATQKQYKVDTLKRLQQRGHIIIHYPIENEYTTLLRVIGPTTGYLACIQFVNTNWPNAIPPCEKFQLISAIIQSSNNIPDGMLDRIDLMRDKGFVMLAPPHINQYGENLNYKLTEGLFLRPHTLKDCLTFIHYGVFQELVLKPRPIILFQGPSHSEKRLIEQVKACIQSIPALIFTLTSNLPQPWSIIEFECILNHFVLQGIKKYNIDQINWPGKNLDSSLYELQEPLA